MKNKLMTAIETRTSVKRVTAMTGMMVGASIVMGAILTWMALK
ncbi:MAG: hypothetical protein WC610_02885 [Patescibacteria group bacterium]